MLDEPAVADFSALEPFADVVVVVEGVLEALLDVLVELLLDEDEELDESDVSEGRGFESVTYQPEPLNMIPAG